MFNGGVSLHCCSQGFLNSSSVVGHWALFWGRLQNWPQIPVPVSTLLCNVTSQLLPLKGGVYVTTPRSWLWSWDLLWPMGPLQM